MCVLNIMYQTQRSNKMYAIVCRERACTAHTPRSHTHSFSENVRFCRWLLNVQCSALQSKWSIKCISSVQVVDLLWAASCFNVISAILKASTPWHTTSNMNEAHVSGSVSVRDVRFSESLGNFLLLFGKWWQYFL